MRGEGVALSPLLRYLQVAEHVARAAGRLIRESLEQREAKGLTIESKGGVDMVTEVDKACEELIIGKLKAEFPSHHFVGEETTFSEGGSEEWSDEPTWVIDPLDGTTNYVHGYTFVAVSIGLMINKVPVVGIIYNPLLDEMYTACKGGGAFLNKRPIRVGKATGVGDALLVNNVGSSRSFFFIDRTLLRLRALLEHQLQGLRNSGSAAQNLAHVACGRLDCYYEDGYGGPWDVAAGKIIVEEAGGIVRHIDGTEFRMKLGKGKVVAGNAAVVEDVVRKLRRADMRFIVRKVYNVVSLAATVYVTWGLLSSLVGRRASRH